MSIFLEDVDLTGLYAAEGGCAGSAPPLTVAEIALDGTEVVWEGPATTRRITLTSNGQHGWLTRETLDRLTTMAAVAGASYSLTLHDRTMRVRFCNEQPPAVAANPVEPSATQGPHAPFWDVRILLVAVS